MKNKYAVLDFTILGLLLALCSSLAVASPDDSFPTVSITSPTSNSVFPAGTSIGITAAAADADGTISKVEFFNGSAKIGEDFTAPYSINWASSVIGVLVLTAKATDNANNTTTSRAVVVSAVYGLPSISITSPSNNAAFATGMPINIAATAADVDGKVTKVEFFASTATASNIKLGEDLTAPYSFVWMCPAGTYSLTAKVTDNSNNTAVSAAIPITVIAGLPVVSITSPANGSVTTAGTAINIAANATAVGASISKVEFFEGNNKLGEDLTAPYSISWNTATVADGTYSLTAKATNNLNSASTSAAVLVGLNRNLPKVSITSPANGAVFTAPATITIAADAADVGGSITKVEFFKDGIKLGEDLTAPYSFTLTGAAEGAYWLTAKATDNSGGTTTSSAVMVVVYDGLPTVRIQSPANGRTFPVGVPIVIDVIATDVGSSISKVEFFAGTTKLGEDLAAPYSYSWTGAAIGNYALTAKATSKLNRTATSAAVPVSVDAGAPSVKISSPIATSAYTAPATINIAANASDVNGSITKVEFFNGTTKLGEDLTAPYTFNWTGVAIGSYSLTAKATDNSNNTTTSAVVPVSVYDGIPVATITSPAPGYMISPGSTIDINATATALGGTVNKVEFFVGTTKIGEDQSPTSYNDNVLTYSCPWTGSTVGTYSLTVKATTNKNKTAVSAAVEVQVQPTYCIPYYDAGCSSTLASFDNFTFNTLANANSGCGKGVARGYTNYAPAGKLTTAVNRGEEYYMSMKSGAILLYYGVWIDYNQDNDFDDAGEFVYASPANSSGLLYTYITIPLSAALGQTRMRVRSSGEPAAITQDQSCTAIESGEAEDYTITINGTNRASITSPSNNSIIVTPASINITAAGPELNSGTITKMEFFNGSTKLGEDLTAPYSFNWTGMAVGNYSLKVKSTNTLGTTTISPVTQVQIVNPVPPTIRITSPKDGYYILPGPDINITADATAIGENIKKVEFFNGTIKLGEDLTAPFSYNWVGTPIGKYILTAKATSNSNLTTTSAAVTIMVDSGPPDVKVTVTNPASALTAPATLNIAASADDGAGKVTKVEFFNGSTKLGEDLTAPYTFQWTNVDVGNYTIIAKATDNSGSINTSYIYVFVTDGTPTVSINTLATNITYTAPATVNLEATAATRGGSVTKVEFFNGATKLGEDLTAPYSFSWNGVAAGTYSLTARATSNNNKTATSAVMPVTVFEPYCIPVYTISCSPTAAFINYFSFNDLVWSNSGCSQGTVNGYAHYYATPYGILTTSAALGRSYVMSMQASNVAQYFGVWIDYNKDNDFNDAGEFVYASPVASTARFSVTIAIPVTAVTGQTRMRVRSNVGSPLTSAQSCTSMSRGETEDYTISIYQAYVKSASSRIGQLDDEPEINEAKGNIFRSYPNPFTDKSTVELSFGQDQEYDVEIYNAAGSLIKSMKQGKVKANNLIQVEWVDEKMPSGLYLLRLVTKEHVQTIRVLKK